MIVRSQYSASSSLLLLIKSKIVSIREQDLSCRRQKTSRLCKISRYVQRCYGTVRFIIYNTDSKSSGVNIQIFCDDKDWTSIRVGKFLETIGSVIAETMQCATSTLTLG